MIEVTNEGSTNERKKPLPFLTKTGDELMTATPENIPQLVDGLLPLVGTSILSADPKTGKSCFARQLAVAVAEGKPFLNFPTVCGDVLLLHLEGSELIPGLHFRKLGHTDKRGKIHVVSERMPENLPNSLARLAETAKLIPDLRLIVIDPLFKILRLSDSNSADEVVKAMEQIEAFAKTHNLHVMSLCHEKKRKADDRHQNAIGSVGFRGSSDVNLSLTKQGKQRVLSAEQRWGTELQPTFLVFDLETQSVELGVAVEDAHETEREDKQRATTRRIEKDVLDCLLGGPVATADILSRVTGKNATKLNVLSQMVTAGKIIANEVGKSVFYSLPQIPSELEAA